MGPSQLFSHPLPLFILELQLTAKFSTGSVFIHRYRSTVHYITKFTLSLLIHFYAHILLLVMHNIVSPEYPWVFIICNFALHFILCLQFIFELTVYMPQLLQCLSRCSSTVVYCSPVDLCFCDHHHGLGMLWYSHLVPLLH